MGYSRTTSLHSKLPVDVRSAVERDLVEQPPGRETYANVFEHYQLADYGVSIKALERQGGYLRKLARDRKIGRLADSIVGRDLGADIAGQIRARLYEVITSEDPSLGDLLKASITEANVTKAVQAQEEWELKQQQLQRALTQTEKTAEQDPAAAYAEMVENVRAIYGIGGDA